MEPAAVGCTDSSATSSSSGSIHTALDLKHDITVYWCTGGMVPVRNAILAETKQNRCNAGGLIWSLAVGALGPVARCERC